MRALVIGAVVILVLGLGYLVVRQFTAVPTPATEESQPRDVTSETDTYKIEARKKRAEVMESMRKEYGQTNETPAQ